jgi:hypothetical protein
MMEQRLPVSTVECMICECVHLVSVLGYDEVLEEGIGGYVCGACEEEVERLSLN